MIPAKNEADNIGWVLERLPRAVDEVVLVDGCSSDDTIEVSRRIRPDVVVVTEPRHGKGAALRAGVQAARGEIVVMLDADGSMDPAEIERFIEGLRDGHDLAKGSRFMPGAGTGDITPLRSAGNRALLALANVLYRSSHTDLCYGFAAFRRETFLGLDLTADGFEIEAQLFLRARRHALRVVEIPSFEAPRRFGNSNLNTFRDGWRVLRTILGERLRRPTVLTSVTVASTTVATMRLASTTVNAAAPEPNAPAGSGPLPTLRVARATVSVAAAEVVGSALEAAGRPAPAQNAIVEIGVLPRWRDTPDRGRARQRQPMVVDLDADLDAEAARAASADGGASGAAGARPMTEEHAPTDQRRRGGGRMAVGASGALLE